MNERDAVRYASRRASLIQAVRDGDAPVAARAGARLRLPHAVLGRAEFARARQARRLLGLAIVKARLPKRAHEPLAHVEVIAAPTRSMRKYALAAVAMAALLLFFLRPGALGPEGAPAGGEPVEPAAEPDRVTLLLVSRGRTIVLPPEIVAVHESQTPTPSPTAEPSPTASPTPAASGVTGTAPRTGTPRPTTGTGGAGGGAGGGSGGGSGGGGSGGGSGGGGGGGGIISPAPTPTPAPTPPLPPPGFGRFNVIVLDASTGRPLADTCVVIGTATCDPTKPHTDTNGRWSADIPVFNSATLWDMHFIKLGYTSQVQRITLTAGGIVTRQILLRRSF